MSVFTNEAYGVYMYAWSGGPVTLVLVMYAWSEGPVTLVLVMYAWSGGPVTLVFCNTFVFIMNV